MSALTFHSVESTAPKNYKEFHLGTSFCLMDNLLYIRYEVLVSLIKGYIALLCSFLVSFFLSSKSFYLINKMSMLGFTFTLSYDIRKI